MRHYSDPREGIAETLYKERDDAIRALGNLLMTCSEPWLEAGFCDAREKAVELICGSEEANEFCRCARPKTACERHLSDCPVCIERSVLEM